MTTRTLFTRAFWVDTFERATFTFAEAAGGVLGIDIIRNAVTDSDFSSLYWTGGGVLIATGLAVLKAIAFAAKNDVDSASAVPASISPVNGS
jgi:hypothetical protein